MFDKEEYWKRRHNQYTVKTEDGEEITIDRPMRGQKDTAVTLPLNGTARQLPDSPNRAMRRRRVVDRTFTKKGYEYGIKIGSRKYNKLQWLVKVQSE